MSVQQIPSSSANLNKGTATSLTNLTSVSSLSSTSLASSNGGVRNKRKAPKPPAGFTLQAQTELEEEFTTTENDNPATSSFQNIGPSKSNNSNQVDEDGAAEHSNNKKAEVNETDKDEQDFVVHKRKPITQRSSSSMSSLNYPTPPSDSASSSPLPQENQQTSLQPKSKRTVPSAEAAAAAVELDSARSSSSQGKKEVIY